MVLVLQEFREPFGCANYGPHIMSTIEQLLDVSDAGAIMPTKSTWFEPKLRSGLFVHSLD